MAPLAIGSVLMTMIYAGGHISGAHYNPAVTLALWMRGRCPTQEVPGYIVAQVVAAVAAAIFVLFLKGHPTIKAAEPDIVRALAAEFVFTFALAYVVLNVATAKGTEGNSFYGLAIGFLVLVGAISVGWVSGAAFNPAVGFSATLGAALSRMAHGPTCGSTSWDRWSARPSPPESIRPRRDRWPSPQSKQRARTR